MNSALGFPYDKTSKVGRLKRTTREEKDYLVVMVTPVATTLISGASTSSGSTGRADSLGREAGRRRRRRRRETVLLERKIFFGPLVRIELIFGGVIVGADGDAVSTSPAESESGGGREIHAIRCQQGEV